MLKEIKDQINRREIIDRFRKRKIEMIEEENESVEKRCTEECTD